MITAKDLEAIEKIKAFIVEQGYTEIHVDLVNTEKMRAPVNIYFRQASSQTEGEDS
jgi:endo-1,4-beta-D-glucanase Y